MLRASTALRVLVVEDDSDTADSLALLLRLWGHDACICRTGADALRAAPGYAPDAVLLDIGLPGLSGWDVARQLRGSHPLVLIGLSGFGQEKDHERARREGFDHFLVKPADPEQLERLLIQVAATAPVRQVAAVHRAERPG
jgi:DNA-binding response OmpR family regulator